MHIKNTAKEQKFVARAPWVLRVISIVTGRHSLGLRVTGNATEKAGKVPALVSLKGHAHVHVVYC